jgi:hypothetical protein
MMGWTVASNFISAVSSAFAAGAIVFLNASSASLTAFRNAFRASLQTVLLGPVAPLEPVEPVAPLGPVGPVGPVEPK